MEKKKKKDITTFNNFNIMQDAMYYENLLNNLQLDRRSQCKVILRTTIMGQIAAEETNDIEMKYKHITRDVWNNMKERDTNIYRHFVYNDI